ncbi:uncharacterized protein LOC123559994 [Mercenaria mercenaria]|uniref:uncharacterized protein LOC123559994 n=1 Tax=Mercenaria mercenaria TaxID=6596 RepID=UPI00234E6932|nr:uncharacterized protein LOC123559994 [Mercenaria mercenaria]
MAECARKRKRDKILEVSEEFDPIFRSFLAKQDKKDELEQALIAVKRGIWALNLASLHIDDCNARSNTYFSSATLSTTPIKWENDGSQAKGVAFGETFQVGVDVLENFLSESPKIPADKQKRTALQKLIKFLIENDHQSLFEKQNSEANWCVTVAQHLLSELAVNSTYTVSAHPNPRRCPCGQEDVLVGIVGDTSFGCRKGWHGQTDIIMEEGLPISVIQNSSYGEQLDDLTVNEFDDSASEDISFSSFENKARPDFREKDTMKIMAETIVFSFLQQKLNKGILKNTLIPGIGISGQSLLLIFYDSVNDVLISSKPKQLFHQNTINCLSVLALWLTLNYRLFCTGVTERMKKYKADFFRRVDGRLGEYTDEVERPLLLQPNTQDDLFPWSPAARAYETSETDVNYLLLEPDSPKS